jgi:hypothetical protein
LMEIKTYNQMISLELQGTSIFTSFQLHTSALPF